MGEPIEIDVDDTTRIATDEGGAEFHALAPRAQTAVVDALYDRHDETDVDGVLGPLQDWKRSSYANYARTHERVIKRAYGLDAPERNGDLLARDPTDGERDVVRDVRDASRRFVSAHFGDRVRLYRGITRAVPGAVRELFAAPDVDSVPLETTVLANFTTERAVAASYGLLVIEADVASDAVAVAADQVFRTAADGAPVSPEGEIRVLGERLSTVKAANVVFPTSGSPVRDALSAPDRMSDVEHRTLLDVLCLCDERGVRFDGEHAERTLWAWFDAYRDTVGFDDRTRLTAVDALLRRLSSA